MSQVWKNQTGDRQRQNEWVAGNVEVFNQIGGMLH